MLNAGPTRVAPRRPLTMNLRFPLDGALHRGVSENVSATGMFVHSAHVPSAGEVVTLTRISPGHEVRAEIIAEVRWGHSTATLDHPRPGFGIHFMEIYADEANRDGLIALLDALGVQHPASNLRTETRGEATLAVYHFS